MRHRDRRAGGVLRVEFIKLNAALRDHQLLLREALAAEIQRLEVVPGIPVEGDPGDHLVGLGVHHVPQPLVDALLVVVPEIDFDVRQRVLFHGGPHIVPQEGLFLPGGVDAAVPGLHGVRLVLQREHPHVKALFAVPRDIRAEVLSPVAVVLAQQLAAALASAVRLPLRRGRPGGQHQSQLMPGGLLRVAQHGQDVALDALEALVLAERKVAAVDRDADERIVHALRGEIRLHQLPLLPLVHQRIDIARALGDRAAKALEALIADLGIEIDDLVFRLPRHEADALRKVLIPRARAVESVYLHVHALFFLSAIIACSSLMFFSTLRNSSTTIRMPWAMISKPRKKKEETA